MYSLDGAPMRRTCPKRKPWIKRKREAGELKASRRQHSRGKHDSSGTAGDQYRQTKACRGDWAPESPDREKLLTPQRGPGGGGVRDCNECVKRPKFSLEQNPNQGTEQNHQKGTEPGNNKGYHHVNPAKRGKKHGNLKARGGKRREQR